MRSAAPRIHVLLRHNKCTVSVDASGALTPRSWCLRQGKDPLRESLASAAVYLSPILHLLSQQTECGASSVETESADPRFCLCCWARTLQRVLSSAALAFMRRLFRLTVCDPFCGSGTLLIEMLALASGTPATSPLQHFPFLNVGGSCC